jgi:hypothetical protein
MRAGLMIGLAALAACGAAKAQTPPEGIVWLALRDINAYAFDRDDPTNRPPLVTEVPEGMIRAVDVSHDGRPDWLLDYEPSGLNGYCGTGGCLKRLYVSVDDGYARAFDNQALRLVVLPDRQVEAWVHPIYCADDTRDCRYRFGWSPEGRRLELIRSTSARAMGEESYPAIDPETERD